MEGMCVIQLRRPVDEPMLKSSFLQCQIVGLNRKIQIKPRQFEEYRDDNGEIKVRCTEVQLVLKWGGNLTKLGMSMFVFISLWSEPAAHDDSCNRGEAVDSFGTETPS
jgi:hypothetical protein